MSAKILSVDEFETQLRDLAETSIGTGDVNDDSQYGALLAAYRALHERCRDQERALEECAAQFEPSGSGLLGDIVLMKSELAALRERLDAPELAALLTRDRCGYYNLWVIPENKKPDAAAPAFTYSDASAVPESLRLPLNGGPAKVRLVMLPAKEADDGDN